MYQLIIRSKTKFFLWNTDNTDENGVNKQNTYTTNTQRKITLERMEGWVGPTMSLAASIFFLVFDSAKEGSNDVTNFWTWYLSLHRNQYFFEKILHANKI